MNERDTIEKMINANLGEMSDTIDCLYITSNSCAKNRLLNRLRRNLSNLSVLVRGLQSGESAGGAQTETTRLFTPGELAGYNGRDGNKAYVAVGGVVYDVTDSAAWGGATHFGLAAGTDVTGQFNACHAGQPVLGKLKAVGKMTG